jgi:hypothetical protein
MNRRRLIYACITLAFVGIVVAAIPFVASLAPNDRSRASLPLVDVADLGVGEFKVIEHLDRRIYVLHLAADQFTALWVPLSDGAVVMPDMQWFRPAGLCRNFGPDHESGVLVADARFTCRDVGSEAWLRTAWLWDAAGHYVGPAQYPMQDMPQMRFELVGSQLLLKS